MAGWLDRLRAGLGRTAEGIAALLARPLDAEGARRLEERLLASDLGPETAAEVVAAVAEAWRREPDLRAGGAAEVAAAVLARRLGAGGAWRPDWSDTPVVILLVGVNGAGKTTTAAKLAHRLGAEGHPALLGACDTFRAAAGAQLEAWASRLGVPLVGGRPGADPAAVAFDAVSAGRARGMHAVLLDSAGRLHTKAHLMEELRKVARVAGKARDGAPQERWLVVDGSLGANSIEQARVFHEAVGLTGLVVTKLDGAGKGGAAVGIARATGVPVRFIGVGEGPDDLQPLDPEAYARALVGL
jgi:fused signal recognition particle receptor